MTMTNPMPSPSTTKLSKSEQIRNIDTIAASAMALFGQASSLEEELQVAQAMGELRTALTPEIMAPIMALMNTNIGFKTDRDPNRPSKGQAPTPYSVDVVREVFIEARLRGFHTIGNEFNIISGGFYATKSGLERKCKEFPSVTDFKVMIDVPKTAAGGAIVPCKSTWLKSGVADAVEANIPVKINDFMGADAIIGKAQRKILKRAYDQMSGKTTPEGEVGDDAPLLPEGPKTPSQPLFSGPTGQSATQGDKTPPSPVSEPPQGVPAPNVQKQKAIAALSAKMEGGNVGVDQIIAWFKEKGETHPETIELSEVPTSKILGLLSKFDEVKDQIAAITI